MNATARTLTQRLIAGNALSAAEFARLLDLADEETDGLLQAAAVKKRKAVYGNRVFVRGLIEIGNYCRNDCYYCGIRKSNKACERYRLTPEKILSCADEGYRLGFRTFVLQGGEDAYFTDGLLGELIGEIKRRYPECAVTLSLGERGEESFRALFAAGADRYLLRHETADETHYAKLHPPALSYKNRMRSLSLLREIGYAVGAGFMVGSPYQTNAKLGEDLFFIQEFKPEMCGIGPFIPHKETPFARYPAGTLVQTLRLLRIIRLMLPNVLLPATTALGTIDPTGREKGILAGANVVMPNLSPVAVRKKYELYDNKICTGEESAQCKDCLAARMRSIGYEIVVDRGDPANMKNTGKENENGCL